VSEAKAKLVPVMAAKYGIDPDQFMNTVKATVFPAGKQVTNEQACMFLVVANEYDLNPFIKEIYAFPGRSGGIVPVVSVDGWLTIINRQPDLDGIEFEDRVEDGKLVAVTARIYRKTRSRPTEVTEYMSECYRDTDVWKRWPNRMLRHKATIQAARYAFGLSGIYEPDEAERIQEAIAREAKTVGKEIVAVITEPQRVALVDAARQNGHNLSAVVNSAGYSLLANIPVSRYEEILDIVSQPKERQPEVSPEDLGPDTIDGTDAIEGEPVFDEDEAILIDLREAVSTAINEKIGKKANDQALYLKGRSVKTMSAEELDDMLHELQSI
jgi:phage recombination protein Bet